MHPLTRTLLFLLLLLLLLCLPLFDLSTAQAAG
jgi:hypothetical protein